MKNRIITISLREIKSSFKRFLSLLIMSFLGVAVFIGLREAPPVLLASLDKYYDDNSLYDIKIQSTLGLTDKDVEELINLDTIAYAFGVHSKDVYFNNGEEKSVIKIIEYMDDVNSVYLESGRMPIKDDEILVEENLLVRQNKKVGDVISISDEDGDLNYNELTIVGTISSPLYIMASTPSTTRGMTSIGTGSINYYTFARKGLFNMDCYTEVYAHVYNAKEEITSYDKYVELIDKAKEEIDTIKSSREESRYLEMKEEYSKKIDEEEAKGRKKLNNAKKQLNSFKSQLDNAKYQIDNGKRELESGDARLAEALREIEKAKKELASGEEKLKKSKKELEDGEAKLNSELAKYGLTIDDVKTIREILRGNEVSKDKLKALIKLDTPYYESVNKVIDYLYEHDFYHLLKNYLDTGLESAKKSLIAVIPKDIDNYDKVIDYINSMNISTIRSKTYETLMNTDNVEKVKKAIPKSLKSYAKIISFLNKYSDSVKRIKELFKAIDDIDAGKKEIAKAEKEIANAKKKIEDGQREYEEGKARLEQARINLPNAEKEYKKNLELYNSKLREYNKGLKDFNEKIRDARADLNSMSIATWYVNDRADDSEYSGFIDVGKSIDNLAHAFPSIFFIVSIFMSLMSMSRMAMEDRSEIGTLKALGFSNKHIMLKYLIYSVAATVIGGLLGAIFGFYFLTWFVWFLYKMLYNVRAFTYYYSIWPLFVGIIISVICITGAALLTVKSIVKEKTASLLRPKAPPSGKKIFFERFKVWNRIKFSNKVTIRNVVRYKKRVIMTIIGIMGCTILLITGYGIRDSIVKIADYQFGNIFKYDALVYLDDKDKDLDELFDSEHINHRVNSNVNQVKMGVTNINLYTLDGKYDDIVSLNSIVTHKKATLEKDKAVISDKLATMKKLKIGDKFKFTDIDEKEYELEVSDIVENYVSNYIYIDRSTYEDIIGEYKTNVVLITFDDINNEESITTELMKNHHVMSIVKRAQTMSNVTNMLKSLDYIVLILLVLSGSLAFVVLYNLSYINISERKREIATLKVLGFYNIEVDNYIIKENFIITVIGILLGMLLSKPFVNYVVDAIEMDLVKFIHHIDILSYLYTFGFMILFTIIVSIIIHHALRKIDMIESLKSIE